MFSSATFKLTAWYLAIIMIVSLFFSYSIYLASSREVRSGLQQQTIYIHNIFVDQFSPDNDLELLRAQQLAIINQRILSNLIALNLVVLVLGGGASYLLARRTLKPIQDAMEAQSRFTADASHELRTPLTAMKTEIEVSLRDKGLGVGEARELLASNLEEIGKLEALSNGLLRLAQYQQGMTQPRWKTVELPGIVSDAMARVEHAATMAQIGFEVGVPDKLQAEADPESLEELLIILLDNAIKYGQSNTVVAIHGKQQAGDVVLTVQDHGVGIKSVDLPHIFDRFYRADTSRSKNDTSGYGLGLSIAKQIVDIHHGTIEVESKLGKGTTFTVTIPSKQSAAMGTI